MLVTRSVGEFVTVLEKKACFPGRERLASATAGRAGETPDVPPSPRVLPDSVLRQTEKYCGTGVGRGGEA